MHQIFHDAADPSCSLSNRGPYCEIIGGFKRREIRPGRKIVNLAIPLERCSDSSLVLGTIAEPSQLFHWHSLRGNYWP